MEISPNILIDGWRNPEYKINGLSADLHKGSIKNGLSNKTKQIKSFIKTYNNQFPDAKLPEEYKIVFNTTTLNIKENEVLGIASSIYGRFNVGKKLLGIYINDNGKTIYLERTLLKSTIEKMLIGLYKK